MAQIRPFTVHVEAGASVRLLKRALELIDRIDDPTAGQVKKLLLEMAQEAIIARPDDEEDRCLKGEIDHLNAVRCYMARKHNIHLIGFGDCQDEP